MTTPRSSRRLPEVSAGSSEGQAESIRPGLCGRRVAPAERCTATAARARPAKEGTLRRVLAFAILLLSLLSGCSGSPVQPTQVAGTPSPEAAAVLPFKVRYTLELQEGLLTGQTYFLGDYVVEMVPGSDEPDAIFDLSRMSWREMDDGRTIAYSDCEAWLDSSAAKTRESLASMPEGAEKRFVQSLLDPALEVELVEGALTLRNEFLVYEVLTSPFLLPYDLHRFYLYDRISACRKAMVLREVPPYAQHQVSAELESRGLFPDEIRLTIETSTGKTRFRTSYAVESMTDAEVERVRALLSR